MTDPTLDTITARLAVLREEQARVVALREEEAALVKRLKEITVELRPLTNDWGTPRETERVSEIGYLTRMAELVAEGATIIPLRTGSTSAPVAGILNGGTRTRARVLTPRGEFEFVRETGRVWGKGPWYTANPSDLKEKP